MAKPIKEILEIEKTALIELVRSAWRPGGSGVPENRVKDILRKVPNTLTFKENWIPRNLKNAGAKKLYPNAPRCIFQRGDVVYRNIIDVEQCQGCIFWESGACALKIKPSRSVMDRVRNTPLTSNIQGTFRGSKVA